MLETKDGATVKEIAAVFGWQAHRSWREGRGPRPVDGNATPRSIMTPASLRLRHEPHADCVRYDSLRRTV